MKKTAIVPIDINDIKSRMLIVRDQAVLLDRDVAALYQVQTREINQAVRNNPDKFQQYYIFQLDKREFADWKSKILTSNLTVAEKQRIKMGLRHAPYAFTERGLYMLATILKGKTATRATLSIIETYAQVRSMVSDMEALQTEKDGSPAQAKLLTSAGHKLADLIGENLSTQTVETEIELNLAVVKIRHKITKSRKA